MYWLALLTALWLCPSPVLADGGHTHSAVPTLKNQITTVVTIKDNAVTLTFGPIDLPSGHDRVGHPYEAGEHFLAGH